MRSSHTLPRGNGSLQVGNHVGRAPAEVGPPTNKSQCKKGGWRNFTIRRAFKNQGDCIQFVNTGK